MIVTIHKPLNNGGIYFVKSTEPSDNAQEYSEAIKQCFDNVDKWRFPCLTHAINDKGETVAKIRYYDL
jgi:hypothetical protein